MIDIVLLAISGTSILVFIYDFKLYSTRCSRWINITYGEWHNGKTFEKTISIGVAMYPSQANTLWKAIKFSDEALYVAKEGGRNRVINFEEKMHTTGEEY